MSQTENVFGSIYITIMNSTAITANPFSYSKTCDTYRPRFGQSATNRAGLGRKAFVDDLMTCAMLNSLVRKHFLKRR